MPMHHFATRCRRALAATPAVLAACGALAGTAHAAPETLTIAQTDATVTAGEQAHFEFAGTLDANDTEFPFQLYVFIKDRAVDATCAADYDAEMARAQQNGSANEAALSGVSIGPGSPFSRSLSMHYWKAGSFLICGYVNNDYFDDTYMEASDTLAKAQFQGTAVASSGSGGSGGGSSSSETVTLAQTGAASTVGAATNLYASGTLYAGDTTFNFDLHAFAKDPAWDSTCGGSLEQEEATLQTAHGNEVWLDSGIGWGLGKGPTFGYAFKVTPWKAGPLLICVYVNSDFSTVAAAQVTLNAQALPSSNTNGGNTTPTPAPALKAPAMLKRPSIKRKGSTLTCRAGTWSGTPASHRFRWYIKGKKRVVGKKSKLTLKKAWRGKSFICKVSETNAAGTTTASTHADKFRSARKPARR